MIKLKDQIKRQTKIVATIGPNTHEVPVLKKMLEAGVNITRLNMSHGDHQEHQERINNIRKAVKEVASEVLILLDLSGPKIRTGEVVGESIELQAGKTIIITTDEVESDGKILTVRYKNLPKEVKVGNYILLDDGRRKLLVKKIEGNKLTCQIIIGGTIRSRRGVNLPGAHLSIPTITDKDKNDITLAIKNKVDCIALSFVRTAKDIKDLRALLPKNYNPLIISKIETEEALENIDGILEESDGIMVARGDLAIEVPREKVPVIQKEIIDKARKMKKIVITATQMLESMIHSPVPTRAEVSDIANAIFDGTDAVMLSEESAKGEYPVEAVEVMARVSLVTDPYITKNYVEFSHLSEKDALRLQAVHLSENSQVKTVVSVTKSGHTPRILSSFRVKKPIIAMASDKTVADKVLAYRGVWPTLLNKKDLKSLDELRQEIKNILQTEKVLQKGDIFVVIMLGIKFAKGPENSCILLEKI